MPTVSTNSGAYQSLDELRDRIPQQPHDYYSGGNAELHFDELLATLEAESRGIFETLWGDETPLEETARVDTIASVPTDPAMPLVYPIQDVTQVEYKTSGRSDWETMDAHRYNASSHHLILLERPSLRTLRSTERSNPLTRHAERPGWGDWAEELRVTYDRGFSGGAPEDVKSVQAALIENMLASRKLQDTHQAGSPEELRSVIDAEDVVTDSIRERIGDVTKPGRATTAV